MMRYREETVTQKPIAPPIDLNAGRLDLGRAALVGAYGLAALVISLGAWWLFGVAANGLVQFGALVVGLVGLGIGAIVIFVAVGEWLDHRRRVAEWHTASLATWRQLAGAEQSYTVSEWDLSAENPAHVLLAAILVTRQLHSGSEVPHATRRLVGPYFIAGRRVANLSKHGAEDMARKFAHLGLIEGRGPGDAGVWVPQTADEVLNLIESRW